MSRICFVFFILIGIILSVQPIPVFANISDQSASISSTAQLRDIRIAILMDYLTQYNSPLTPYAADFIKAADQYHIDWKLVVSISGAESQFGHYVPGDQQRNPFSYNAWGWGVYADKVVNFRSWQEGIYTVSKGLRENYLNKGLSNPYTINSVYASDPNWANHVSYFLQDLSHFAQQYPNPDKLTSVIQSPTKQSSERIFLNDAYLKVDTDHFQLIFIDS